MLEIWVRLGWGRRRMNEGIDQKARAHNTVVGILTVAAFGTIAGSITLGWEFWVPPLIVCGLIAAWVIHFTQYGTWSFRENYYLIYIMFLSFYHGVHADTTFEIVVISALLMVNVTLFKRSEFITLMLIEFIVLMIIQTVLIIRTGSVEFNRLAIAKLVLHVIAEFCIYKGLHDVIKNNRIDSEELEARNREKELSSAQMEDFLVNISHELRTPVNVVNGMSSLILKKEDRDDVASIRDAGLKLSSQIEDIQDYSEIKRGDVVLEEDKYMITSIINDIITAYMAWDLNPDLDLIIDLDPTVPAVLKGDAGKIHKIIWHLLDNAVKFTRKGGIYLGIRCIKREYGVNLIIEVSDTGIGISRSNLDKISGGLYQIDRRRNRSTGGIGLGFSIIYGFVRKMYGFVNIDSVKGRGTTVKVSIAQEVIDPKPSLSIDNDRFLTVVMYISSEKHMTARLIDFYRTMAVNMASGLRVNMYQVSDLEELKTLVEQKSITHVFMGEYEYSKSPAYFENLAGKDVTVAVSASSGFKLKAGSRITVMQKPLFGYPIVKVLNGEAESLITSGSIEERRPVLDGVRALVVDDEPMNLVVAQGLFKEYNMLIDTADSGKESIIKFSNNDYDIIFMDHMMPGMDGVEAMKRIKELAMQKGRPIRVVALTANAVSGAREMFMREGFDGFISKPIHISDFERTMNRLLTDTGLSREGGLA